MIILWRAASSNIWSRLRGGLRKNEKLPTMSASAPCSTRVAKAASKSKRRTSTTMISRPTARAAASMALFRSSKIGEIEGPERYAIVVALGISPSKRLSRLPTSSAARKVIPVAMPPGRLRAGDKTVPHRIICKRKDDRNCRAGGLRRKSSVW